MDVEIWSDINCPWCYIGKRRFESALAQFDHAADVDVTWRSFELDPSAPADTGGNSAKMLAEKYGVTAERAQEMEAHVTEVAAGDGLEYNLERSRLGNTFDGHRLIHLAQRHGLQDAMKERLLRARFTDGQLVSDPEVLVACAVLIFSFIMLTLPQFYLLLMAIACSVVVLGVAYFGIVSLNKEIDASEQ